jgi:hypothetical protein
MPRPRTERQALEEERDVELPAKLAKYRRDLDAIPPSDKTRRECEVVPKVKGADE